LAGNLWILRIEGTVAQFRDQEVFLAAIQAIYEAATNPLAWPDALTAIAPLFDGVGCVLLFQREDQSTGTVVSPTLEAAQQAYDRGWWREDIMFVRVSERIYRRELDAIADQHLVSAEEAATHPFLHEFLVPHGMGRLAAVSVAPTRDVGVVLSTHRFIDKPRFDESELRALTHIGRHVENALRLGIRLITAEVAKTALGDALAGLGAGVFLVDQHGHLVFMNPKGEEMLGDALVLKGKRLSARVDSERTAFDDALDTAINSLSAVANGTPRPIILRGTAADEFIAAYIQPAPAPPGDSGLHIFSDVKATVVAMSSKASDLPEPTLVRDLLSVTLAEARVAALVGGGATPRQAANQLGIAEETARTVLKRVFAKTGVGRQSELAGLLERLVLR